MHSKLSVFAWSYHIHFQNIQSNSMPLLHPEHSFIIKTNIKDFLSEWKINL